MIHNFKSKELRGSMVQFFPCELDISIVMKETSHIHTKINNYPRVDSLIHGRKW